MRAIDARKLTLAAIKAHFVAQGTIDGWSLPEQVVDAFDKGQQAHVPLLAGFNSGEIRSQRALLPLTPANAAIYRAEIQRRYRDLAPAFLRLYPSDDIAGSMLATVRDAVYGWATERMIRQQAAAGQPSYLYFFDHCYPAARARNLCDFHASEVPFVFGHVGQGATLPPKWPRPQGKDQQAMSAAMIDYWAGFAKTGVPGAPGLPAWRPYSTSRKSCMHFSDKPRAERHDPVPGMFEMREELFERRRKNDQQWFINVGVAAPVTPAASDRTPAGK